MWDSSSDSFQSIKCDLWYAKREKSGLEESLGEGSK